MSDFNTVRDLPDNYDAYEAWYNPWLFGLPDGTSVGASMCGAMPFRYGGTGVNAQNVLRGEDWAFLISVATRYKSLPAQGIWSNSPLNVSLPYISLRPRKENLQRMYNFLYAAETAQCFGTDISLSQNSGVLCQENAIHSTIAGTLTGLMQIESYPPVQGDAPLSLIEMKRYFRDTQKMQCTIADASYSLSGNSRTVYMYDAYVPSAGMPPETETSDIIKVQLGQSFGNNVQLIRAEGQLIMGFECSVTKNGSTNYYYGVVTVGNRFWLYNSSSQPNIMSATVNVSGQQIANAISNLGVDITPAATTDYNSSCRIRPRWRYCVVWPKWLINYTWPEDANP